MTHAELAAELTRLTEQEGKIAAEQATRFDALTQAVNDLKDALAAAGNVTPEVSAALLALKGAVQSLDDSIPDAPVEPPQG